MTDFIKTEKLNITGAPTYSLEKYFGPDCQETKAEVHIERRGDEVILVGKVIR